MIKIILVRHGQTDDNMRKAYLGHTDVELNEVGRYQAKLALEKLRNEKFDAFYSSPLKRCMSTSEIINEELSLKIIPSKDLMERNFGKWDNLTYEVIKTKFTGEHDEWVKDWKNYIIENGESAGAAYERTKNFIDNLIVGKNNGNFLIVTHLGCIRNIISYLIGLGIEGSWRFRIDNCGITDIEITEGYSVLTKLNY